MLKKALIWAWKFSTLSLVYKDQSSHPRLLLSFEEVLILSRFYRSFKSQGFDHQNWSRCIRAKQQEMRMNDQRVNWEFIWTWYKMNWTFFVFWTVRIKMEWSQCHRQFLIKSFENHLIRRSNPLKAFLMQVSTYRGLSTWILILLNPSWFPREQNKIV